jgi:lipoprotein NlpD
MREAVTTCIKPINEVSVRSNSPFRAVSYVMFLTVALVLTGCTSSSRAPVSSLWSGVPTSSTYVVKPGDTLNKISRATGVPEATLTRINKISNPNLLNVGQTLRLSDSQSPAAASRAPSDMSSQQSSRSTSTNETSNTRAADAGIINWGWPAKGKIIQGFTPTTKGIDISGSSGDPIEAAAPGKVIFAGDGPRGLGNLIIVEHSDGFITAYAHNKTLLVKEGQVVKRGAKIAEMGQSDTTSVRLHFEIRRRGTPVDPMQYLPQR